MNTYFKRPDRVRRGLASCALFGAMLAWLPASHAALTLSGTRLVFDAAKRNAPITVSNPSRSDFAVQSWVNTAADDQTTAVPFSASPALFRIKPGKEQQVLIHGLPNTLPKDRESLFYFNIQEIPQADSREGNRLNVALRSRIKLFYRPSGLGVTPMESLNKLSWSIRTVNGQAQLQVDNPGPYHVSFLAVELQGAGQKVEIKATPMALPMAKQHFTLDGFKPGPGTQVNFTTINDYGGYTALEAVPVAVDL